MFYSIEDYQLLLPFLKVEVMGLTTYGSEFAGFGILLLETQRNKRKINIKNMDSSIRCLTVIPIHCTGYFRN